MPICSTVKRYSAALSHANLQHCCTPICNIAAHHSAALLLSSRCAEHVPHLQDTVTFDVDVLDSGQRAAHVQRESLLDGYRGGHVQRSVDQHVDVGVHVDLTGALLNVLQ